MTGAQKQLFQSLTEAGFALDEAVLFLDTTFL